MAHYDVYTDNGLTKWVITGAGSGSRLSDVMDDTSPLPGQVNITYGVWYRINNGTYVDTAAPEYTIALTTEPDGDSGDDLCIYHKEDTDWLVRGTAGSLASGEWDWAAGTLSIRLLDDGDPDTEDLYIYYAWSHFMTETVEDGIYLIHLNLEVGDGSTPTTLSSLNEHVYFDDGFYVKVKTSATASLGELHNGGVRHNSFWSVSASSQNFIVDGGTLNVYGSIILNRAAQYQTFSTGTMVAKKAMFGCRYDIDSSANRRWNIRSGFSTCTLEDVYFYNAVVLSMNATPDVMDRVWLHDVIAGIQYSQAGTITVNNCEGTDVLYLHNIGAAGITVNSVDQLSPNTVVKIGGSDESNTINEQYTVNITVVDKDGTGIVGATVACAGSDSGTASEEYDTVGFTTADTGASGVLAEQTVTVKKWVGTSETETNYNYFKFTISEPGYETLVMEKVTIDAPIVWHLELQPKYKMDSRGNYPFIAVNENMVMAI